MVASPPTLLTYLPFFSYLSTRTYLCATCLPTYLSSYLSTDLLIYLSTDCLTSVHIAELINELYAVVLVDVREEEHLQIAVVRL